MIDFTKPIETVSGRRAAYLGRAIDGDYRVRLAGRAAVRHYKADGRHYSGSHEAIRNVALNATRIDWSRPIEFVDGTPVASSVEPNALNRDTYNGKTCVRVIEGNYYASDGTHIYGNAMSVRNVAIPAAPAAPSSPALDLDKPLQTADGKPVRLLARDASGAKPLVVEVRYPGGTVAIEQRFADGKTSSNTMRTSGDDLKNVVVEEISWRNVYSDGTMGKTAHKTHASARDYSKVGKTRAGIMKYVTRNGAFFVAEFTASPPRV